MRRTTVLCLCLALLLTLPACKAKKMLDQASISADLARRGTADLLKEAGKDKYEPPADGRLTDAQVGMYMKVREHEKQIAKVAKEEMQKHAQKVEKSNDKSLAGVLQGFQAMGSAADFLTADIRAAKDLGVNTQEYLWVKGQILEARSAAMMTRMTAGMNAALDAQYAQLKKQHDEAKDESTKKLYGEMLSGYEKSKQESAKQAAENQNPALAYNLELLSKHEGSLNAIATELSKYENKEGEVKASLQKWENELDKSVQEAQKTKAAQ